MIEVDVRICLDDVQADFSPEDLVEMVQDALRNKELATKLWRIGNYHDAFVRKIADKSGTLFKDKFSYL